MEKSLKKIGCLIALLVHFHSLSAHVYYEDENPFEADEEEYCETRCRPRYCCPPYNPEEEKVINDRQGSHWPGKREGDFFENMTK